MADHQQLASERLGDFVENAVNSSYSTPIVTQLEPTQWVTRTLLSIAATLLLSFVLTQFFSPSFDLREPPPLKPRIPFIGHILSLIRYQTDFLLELSSVVSQLSQPPEKHRLISYIANTECPSPRYLCSMERCTLYGTQALSRQSTEISTAHSSLSWSSLRSENWDMITIPTD